VSPNRGIGSKVSLSVGGVHKVIKRQLRQSADRRDELATDASVEAYLSQMEALLSATWPKALRGDVRVTDQCRRVLDSMAKVQGIVQSVSERLLPDDLNDNESDDDDDATNLTSCSAGGATARSNTARGR
jgi:hypothetical protein